MKLEIAPDTLEAQVPNLILQPLVENAIRHGIEPHARPGRIELRARRQADRLTLEVSDNGAACGTTTRPKRALVCPTRGRACRNCTAKRTASSCGRARRRTARCN